MCSGRSARAISEIGRRREAAADDTVVVEHRLAVGGDPHVALEAGGAEAHGQAEGVERVLRSMGPRPAVGEADGRAQGGEPGHPTSMPPRAGPGRSPTDRPLSVTSNGAKDPETDAQGDGPDGRQLLRGKPQKRRS